MSILFLLAPLTGGKRDALALSSAFAAAAPLQAHVRALFVRPDPTEALPYFGDEVAPVMASEIVDASREAADAASQAARASLESAAAAAGFEMLNVPSPGPSASFLEMQGHFADCIARAGVLADLIVFGPFKDDDRPGLTDAFETALLKTGTPVFLGSESQRGSFDRVMVGWDGSLTSARAVSASLPYLAKAQTVQIVTVQGGSSESELDMLMDYLRVHGVDAQSLCVEGNARPVGDVLMESATANGADLLVIGGYGHSRFREWLFGGVTRRILSQAMLPLFLAH